MNAKFLAFLISALIGGYASAYQGTGNSGNVTAHDHSSLGQGGPLKSITVSTVGVTGNLFSVGGSTFVVRNGLIGISTDTPQVSLDFAQGSSNQGQIINLYSNSNFHRMGFGMESATSGMRVYARRAIEHGIRLGGISDDSSMTWTQFLWMDSANGMVGISTPVMTTTLEVSGGVKVSSLTILAGKPDTYFQVFPQSTHVASATFQGGLIVSAGNSVFKSSIASLGVVDGSDAPAGYIGEYITATASAQNAPPSGTYSQISTITLTAGDWDVSAVGYVTPNGATWTATGAFYFVIGTATGDNTTGGVLGNSYTAFPLVAATEIGASLSGVRISITGTTTYYLKTNLAYSVAIPKISCRISARRVR